MSISLSEASAALEVLGQPAVDALQLIDSAALVQQYYPLFNLPFRDAGAGVGAVLPQPRSATYCCRLTLPITRGSSPGVRRSSPWAILDRGAAARTLFVPPLPLARRLCCSPERGRRRPACARRLPVGPRPDVGKLRASLLEETYELLAALDGTDPHKVLEEQGDLLLQVALQAQIAAEEGLFRFPDVVVRIVEKLIRRHPHVFGDAVVNGTDEVLANWEAIKAGRTCTKRREALAPGGHSARAATLAQAESYLDRTAPARSCPTSRRALGYAGGPAARRACPGGSAGPDAVRPGGLGHGPRHRGGARCARRTQLLRPKSHAAWG